MRNIARDKPGESHVRPRTTVYFPQNMDRALDILALAKSIPKGDLIKQAVHKFLLEEGLDSSKEISLELGDGVAIVVQE